MRKREFCKYGHRFTKSNTYIRYRNGKPGRQCRKCRYNCTKHWQLKNHNKVNSRQRKYWPIWSQNIRKEVLSYYSNGKLQCVCCGEMIYQFLTLDHINNNGQEDRKKNSGMLNIMLKLRKTGFPEGYQTLCWNCNLGKRSNKGICPHKVKTIELKTS